jgi:hypothetical protein
MVTPARESPPPLPPVDSRLIKGMTEESGLRPQPEGTIVQADSV